MYGISAWHRLRKYTYCMLSIALSVGIITSLYRFTSAQPCHTITITVHGPLSAYGYEELKNFVTQQQMLHAKPTDLIAQLQKQYPFIKHTNCTVTNKQYLFTITLHNPTLHLNQQWLVMDNGIMFENNYYNTHAVAHLHTATVVHNELTDQASLVALCRYVQTLPQEIFAFYSIEWVNDHMIYFHDRLHTHFKLITTAKKTISTELLNHCLRIKSMLNTNGSFKKKTDSWIADLRFSNHIIVAKEGNNYGTKL